jgi:hypothetical protein
MAKGRWLDVSAAPRDGSPILLWIQDGEAPPDFPVIVGVWETDTIFEVGFWRVFSAVAHQPTSIGIFGAGCRCLEFLMPDESNSRSSITSFCSGSPPSQGIRCFYSSKVEQNLD